MINPCEECIVNSMCWKYCDLLTDYVNTLSNNRRRHVDNQIYNIFCAYWLRVSRVDQDIGEVQLFSQTITSDNKFNTHTKRFRVTIMQGDIVNIEYNHPPIDVPMLNELTYYRSNFIDHTIYVGVKTDWGDSPGPKYYPDHRGIRIRFFLAT